MLPYTKAHLAKQAKIEAELSKVEIEHFCPKCGCDAGHAFLGEYADKFTQRQYYKCPDCGTSVVIDNGNVSMLTSWWEQPAG